MTSPTEEPRQDGGLAWGELTRSVGQLADFEALFCIGLLGDQDKAKVAELVRQLLLQHITSRRLETTLEPAAAWGTLQQIKDAIAAGKRREAGSFFNGSSSSDQAAAVAAAAAATAMAMETATLGGIVSPGPSPPQDFGASAARAPGAGAVRSRRLCRAPAVAQINVPPGTVSKLGGSKKRGLETAASKEESPEEAEENFLRLIQLGDDAALVLLQESSEPRRLLTCSGEGGVTALHHAVFGGFELITRRLLHLRADLDRKTDYGFTAVIAAAQSQNLAILQLLLENSAVVNTQTNFDGRAALHFAAASGDLSICQALLDASADVELKDRKGKTAVDKARENSHEEVVHLLDVNPRPSARSPTPEGPPTYVYDAY
eukprot:TRINITY_DN24287_c0_g1_i1.p1 TRINITY_DN24287_c0_g1~~TRINITY_DN24287_c0_g1_i1.p1  ORF type:complete len:375 (-),score=90.75 TRINITY_DN24287_c0_g1_i1:138-1262(-)